jgi:hypothetical protein
VRLQLAVPTQVAVTSTCLSQSVGVVIGSDAVNPPVYGSTLIGGEVVAIGELITTWSLGQPNSAPPTDSWVGASAPGGVMPWKKRIGISQQLSVCAVFCVKQFV